MIVLLVTCQQHGIKASPSHHAREAYIKVQGSLRAMQSLVLEFILHTTPGDLDLDSGKTYLSNTCSEYN